MDCCCTPHGMSRRHFMRHLAGASALALPAFALTRTLRANAQSLAKNHKSAILLWLGGGPPTIDMWDLKPGAPTGGEFKPIATTGDVQICELMPQAGQADEAPVDRAVDEHARGRSRPRPLLHAHRLRAEPERRAPELRLGDRPRAGRARCRELEIPPFVSIGGASEGPGFLGMAYAPFQVDANGQIRDVEMSVPWQRMNDRMKLLGGARDAVHRREPRRGGRGARQGARRRRTSC